MKPATWEEHPVLSADAAEYSNRFPHQTIERLAEAHPDKIAVVGEGESLSFAQLNRQANELAERLQQRGLNKGKVCGVLFKPCREAVVAVLAIHKLGATYLPLDPEAPSQRLEFMIADAAPALVLVRDNTAATSGLGATPSLNLDDAPLTGSDAYRANIDVLIGADDVANIFYTSGTTGFPKGVLATFKNFRYYANSAIQRFSMSSATIMPTVAKLTFSISLFELITPLVAGGTVRIVSRDTVLSPREMLSVLQQCTMAHIGPSLWLRLVQAISTGEFNADAFDHMHHVSTGGDMVPPELLNKLRVIFRNAELFVVYGCSEVSCMGTAHQVDISQPVVKTFVGGPFANSQVAICNYQGTGLTEWGDKGEICISSEGVAASYIGKDADFKNKLVYIGNSCFYRTGDIGRISETGQVEMLGREDFQVKVNGVRIELSEIDYHLRKAPGVTEAISMFWANEDGENRIYAYVTKQFNADEVKRIREYLDNHLLEQMLPRNFIYLEALPLNPNLKVDRNALPKPDFDNIIRESAFGKAASQTEQRLLGIWQKLLKRDDIGVDDDFFYSGGSSLSWVDLLSQVELQLGVALNHNTLLTHRTIRTLAALVDNHQTPAQSPRVVPIRKTDNKRSVFFIHDGNGDLTPYFTLSQQLDTDDCIYGVTPLAKANAPIYTLTFEELVDDYATQIQQLSPSGPMVLGGLCIGGYLAYCVAAQLQARGCQVQAVLLFDSHNIIATPKENFYQNQRKTRLRELKADAKNKPESLKAHLNYASTITKKAYGFMQWQVKKTSNRAYKKSQLFALTLAKRYPGLANVKLPFPDVDTALRAAETRFTLAQPYKGKLVLFRAEKALNTLDHLGLDDTPYKEHFEGDDLGWSKTHTSELIVVPIEAGHSSLLTPPYAQTIADHVAGLGARD